MFSVTRLVLATFCIQNYLVNARQNTTISLKGYLKDYPPSIADNSHGSTAVTLTLKPTIIIAMSPKTMDMQAEVVTVLAWEDHRIDKQIRKANSPVEIIQFDSYITQRLWYPKFHSLNCKGCTKQVYHEDMANMNYNHITNKIQANTYSCNFDLTNYPFDNQMCSIEIDSFSANSLSITYKLYEKFYLNQVVVPPEWILHSITESNCSQFCHSFEFHLQRRRHRSILLVFMPSTLIVILSWLSFWLDPTSSAPRITLGLTSMLTLTTQFSSYQINLPAVSTIMALDVWMFACIFSVFASLIEYSVVNYLDRMDKSEIKIRNQITCSLPIRGLDRKNKDDD